MIPDLNFVFLSKNKSYKQISKIAEIIEQAYYYFKNIYKSKKFLKKLENFLKEFLEKEGMYNFEIKQEENGIYSLYVKKDFSNIIYKIYPHIDTQVNKNIKNVDNLKIVPITGGAVSFESIESLEYELQVGRKIKKLVRDFVDFNRNKFRYLPYL